MEATPHEAFALFTDEIGLWWRTGTRYWNDPERGVSVRIEPYVGGRFIEVYDVTTGEGLDVGHVTAWEPGERVAFTWTQPDWPDDATTTVEVTFEPAVSGTRVRVEHGGFESIPQALELAGGYDTGWKEVLGWFAGHAIDNGGSG